MDFNELLKMHRQNAKLSQRAVAEMLGISLRGYQQYEQGLFEPNIEKLIKLADMFGITVDELIGHKLSKNSLVDAE